jgi:hypothetical protein
MKDLKAQRLQREIQQTNFTKVNFPLPKNRYQIFPSNSQKDQLCKLFEDNWIDEIIWQSYNLPENLINKMPKYTKFNKLPTYKKIIRSVKQFKFDKKNIQFKPNIGWIKILLKIKNVSKFNYVVIHTTNNEQWFIDFENIPEPVWTDEKIWGK